MTWQPGWPQSGTVEDLDRLRPLSAASGHCSSPPPSRPAHTGCFGLHEWAMVHRTDETRHDVPLRLGGSGHRRGRRVAPHRLLALRRLPLLHPDGAPAERAVARPRRPGGVRAAGLPARDDGPLQARLPALAAGRLRPRRRLLRAGVGRPRGRHARVALRLRLVGFEPIRIETAEGKRAYAAHQRAFADRAAPLRARLVEACDVLLSLLSMPDQVTRAIHHFDLWVQDSGHRDARVELAVRPLRLGAATSLEETSGSWKHPDGTYTFLERSPDLIDERHDRLRPGINHLALHRRRPADARRDAGRRAGLRLGGAVRRQLPARRRRRPHRALPGELRGLRGRGRRRGDLTG